MPRGNVLLVATGSVAAIRTGKLAQQLRDFGYDVKLVHTKAAAHFLDKEDALPEWLETYDDGGEWNMWRKLGDPVLHIELRNWASVLVVAPCDANTLAKISNGMCDNLATCVARCWDVNNNNIKPMFVAPAMNTAMWEHPVTNTHINTLREWGVGIIEPVVKILACGDRGAGAMAELPTILHHVQSAIDTSNALQEHRANSETQRN